MWSELHFRRRGSQGGGRPGRLNEGGDQEGSELLRNEVQAGRWTRKETVRERSVWDDTAQGWGRSLGTWWYHGNRDRDHIEDNSLRGLRTSFVLDIGSLRCP